MKILLVDPPCYRFLDFYRYYFPLGLTSIAAVLEQHGHDVLVYDAEHDPSCVSVTSDVVEERLHHYREGLHQNTHPIWEEYRDVLAAFQPELVGISVLSLKIAAARRIAEITRTFNPRVITVAGGEHATVRPQDLPADCFDYVVCGEGELALAKLVDTLITGQPSPRIIAGTRVTPIDQLPTPAIARLHRVDTYRPTDLGLMVTARGCPYHCRFCALATMWGHQVRYHTVERVKLEITQRQERYGVNYFSFRNGTFTHNRSWVVNFCQMLHNRRSNIRWECLTRVSAIDAELLAMIKDSGCTTIRVGIESGNEQILRSMQKGITLRQVRSAAVLLHQSGISWSAYFMLGVPQETEGSIRETLALIEEIDPPYVTLAKFTPLPGTSMYDEVVAAGLLDPDRTDWTWGANQSVEQTFSLAIAPRRFRELMQSAVQHVKAHNARRLSPDDARAKP